MAGSLLSRMQRYLSLEGKHMHQMLKLWTHVDDEGGLGLGYALRIYAPLRSWNQFYFIQSIQDTVTFQQEAIGSV